MFLFTTVNPAHVTATITGFRAYVNLSRMGINTLAKAKSVRVYTDQLRSVECPREIVSASEMYVLIPSLTTSTRLYIDYDGIRPDYSRTSTYGSDAVWSDELDYVGHFQTNSIDSTPASNDAIPNGATIVAGKRGQGYSFDGVNDTIGISRTTGIRAMSALVKRTDENWKHVVSVPADTAIGTKEKVYIDNVEANYYQDWVGQTIGTATTEQIEVQRLGSASTTTFPSASTQYIATFTPAAKTYITGLALNISNKGTGNWTVNIRRVSDSREMSVSTANSPSGEGLNANMPSSGWKTFATNCILEAGIAYELGVFVSNATGVVVSNSLNTNNTVEYRLYSANRIKSVDVVGGGRTLKLRTDSDGVLHNSVINLDAGTFTYQHANGTNTAEAGRISRSLIHRSGYTSSGEYRNYLMRHGTGIYDISLADANAEFVIKINTILPAMKVDIRGLNISNPARTYSVDYSLDGVTWVNVGRNLTVSNHPVIFNAGRRSTFFVKYYKHTTDDSGANYLSSSSLTITANLDLSGIPIVGNTLGIQAGAFYEGLLDEFKVYKNASLTNDERISDYQNSENEELFWQGWQTSEDPTPTPISILVDGIERSTVIDFDSVRKQDNLNDSADVFEFSTLYYAGQPWRPTVNSDISFYVNGIKQFGGVIIEVEDSYEGLGSLRYRAIAKDYSHHFDRLLVTERFENMSVHEILMELITKYAPSFSGQEVNLSQKLARYTFPNSTYESSEISEYVTPSMLTLGTGFTGSGPVSLGYVSDPELTLVPAAGTFSLANAISNNAYIEFTLTPDNTTYIDFQSLTFDIARGGGATPRGWGLYSSLDNYATVISSATIPTQRPTFTSVNVPLTAPAFQEVDTPITFRLYVYVQSTGQSVEIDNLEVNANVTHDYASGRDLLLETVTFDRMPLVDVVNQLASQNNYSWYIDYDKNVHFFAINDEVAPFSLTDTSDNYIIDTLNLKTDFTQIRNRILFKGGDSETNIRTETLSGTGAKEEFVLAYKYAEKPVVEVGGIAKTVGIDNLDDPADFQVLWSYQQKYIKFTSGNVPAAGTDNIEVTGIPLLPLNVRVSDSASISTYGAFEFFKEEPRISTKEDALVFANAELEAYKDPLREGSFETYLPGLRSGQTINVNSALRGVNEDFLIQSVELTLLSQTTAVYRVELSTLKLLKLTTLFQSLFRKKDVDIDSLQSLFSFLQNIEEFTITDSFTIVVESTRPYRYGPTGLATVGKWNKSTWA